MKTNIGNDDDDDDGGLVRMRQGGSTVAWPSLPPDPEHGYDGNQAREHRSRPHRPYCTYKILPPSTAVTKGLFKKSIF